MVSSAVSLQHVVRGEFLHAWMDKRLTTKNSQEASYLGELRGVRVGEGCPRLVQKQGSCLKEPDVRASKQWAFCYDA
eukprot:7719515-Prorocentrum_lima.AAC.1